MTDVKMEMKMIKEDIMLMLNFVKEKLEFFLKNIMEEEEE